MWPSFTDRWPAPLRPVTFQGAGASVPLRRLSHAKAGCSSCTVYICALSSLCKYINDIYIYNIYIYESENTRHGIIPIIIYIIIYMYTHNFKSTTKEKMKTSCNIDRISLTRTSIFGLELTGSQVRVELNSVFTSGRQISLGVGRRNWT